MKCTTRLLPQVPLAKFTSTDLEQKTAKLHRKHSCKQRCLQDIRTQRVLQFQSARLTLPAALPRLIPIPRPSGLIIQLFRAQNSKGINATEARAACVAKRASTISLGRKLVARLTLG